MINIHDRREELGLTLEEVGNICGVGKSTVRKWQTGMISNMKRDKIVMLAKALQVQPTDLLNFDQPEEDILNSRERYLVNLFRRTTQEHQEDILMMLEMWSKKSSASQKEA